MKVKKTEKEVSQEIDLGRLMGRTPTPEEKDAFAEKAIDLIIERTHSGKDVNNKDFRPYTKDYADQKGVNVNEVDMTLFGDMLLDIKHKSNGGKVKLTIDDDKQAIKAYAHTTGYKGHPTINPTGRGYKYKRDFFGLSKEDAQRLAGSVSMGSKPDTLLSLDIATVAKEKQSLDITDILSKIGLEPIGGFDA